MQLWLAEIKWDYEDEGSADWDTIGIYSTKLLAKQAIDALVDDIHWGALDEDDDCWDSFTNTGTTKASNTPVEYAIISRLELDHVPDISRLESLKAGYERYKRNHGIKDATA